MRKKQEDRCDERKWEIEMRKKNEEMCGVREILRLEKEKKKKKEGIDMSEREEINEKSSSNFPKFSATQLLTSITTIQFNVKQKITYCNNIS